MILLIEIVLNGNDVGEWTPLAETKGQDEEMYGDM